MSRVCVMSAISNIMHYSRDTVSYYTVDKVVYSENAWCLTSPTIIVSSTSPLAILAPPVLLQGFLQLAGPQSASQEQPGDRETTTTLQQQQQQTQAINTAGEHFIIYFQHNMAGSVNLKQPWQLILKIICLLSSVKPQHCWVPRCR